MRAVRPLVLALAGCTVLGGCSTASPGGASSGGASSTGSAATSSPATATTSASGTSGATTSASCRAVATGLVRDEQVGQLFMVGSSTTTGDDLARVVREQHVGSVLYLGGSGDRSVAATAAMSKQVQQAAPQGIGVLVATDQEGGAVQRLSGSGFSSIPSATQQAALGPAKLQAAWQGWAGELRKAGVNYDLAPVADVVTAADDAKNAAIGALDRNYGVSPAQVGQNTSAVVQGMARAKVASSLKHYPGLGRAEVNTDFGVATDKVTTAADTASFLPAMKAGASSVMISSTVYARMDPAVPGVFSSKIITGQLRGKQGWKKVVISDDLGAAAAVKDVPAKQRGVRFLQAGGDLVVTADPATVAEMVAGVKEKAASDPSFAAALPEHVARVLALKAEVGLSGCAAG